MTGNGGVGTARGRVLWLLLCREDKGAHVGALVDADRHGAVVAAEAGVAEAAAAEAVADAAAVVQGGPAGEVAGVAAHHVVIRAEELSCTRAAGVHECKTVLTLSYTHRKCV